MYLILLDYPWEMLHTDGHTNQFKFKSNYVYTENTGK